MTICSADRSRPTVAVLFDGGDGRDNARNGSNAHPALSFVPATRLATSDSANEQFDVVVLHVPVLLLTLTFRLKLKHETSNTFYIDTRQYRAQRNPRRGGALGDSG